jgi:hypothetical protein
VVNATHIWTVKGFIQIAVVTTHPNSYAERAPYNARLIAAAPDLLEALGAVTKRLEHLLAQQGITAQPQDVIKAHAAIAKATKS